LDVHLLLRMVHVVTAAIVVGVPVTLAVVLCSSPPAEVIARVGGPIERLQWAALGVMVATGVGNLAAFGGGLPSFDSRWGRTLTIKLAMVVGLLMVSAVRTFVVATHSMPRTAPQRLSDWYAITGAAAVAVVVAAELLAHG
jgi:putative copper export protein